MNSNILRGGRPTYAGLSSLKSQGVKTIIDLEDDYRATRTERANAARLGLRWINSPMNAGQVPPNDQIDRIEAMLEDASLFPIFIHCKHGQDRTGLIIGIYRVETDHVSPSQAYQEMLQVGFHQEYTALDSTFRRRTGYDGP